MKNINRIIIVLVLVIVVVGIATSINTNYKKPNEDLIRIHIRANSNSDYDQNLKLKVKEEVIKYLTPLLANANTKGQAIAILITNLDGLNQKVANVLNKNEIEYGGQASLVVEEFPARMYGDIVVEKGFYDALIVKLGEGKGDNWWCVAFPPLCFVPETGANVRYKSKILEIINNSKIKS